MTSDSLHPTDHIRVRYLFSGMVQGVGFRPFIYRVAVRNGLAGFVRNTSDGVVVEVEGARPSVDAFRAAVDSELPPLADVTDIVVDAITLEGTEGFFIIESSRTGRSALHIAPDIAVCDRCITELFDPADRRYRYPFINCTDCGPRLTIIHDIPYDREKTSMVRFALCPNCRAEYEDPANRRFHAEPNACPVCGPSMTLLDGAGTRIQNSDPIDRTIQLLKSGRIVAIQGLGGFHLAVDATDDGAVRRLRRRKLREEKPLALMVKDIDAARLIVTVDREEERLLMSPQRPIVLMNKKTHAGIAPCVAPGMGTFGIMLPYTPLHHLLFAGDMPPLVMTSGNQSGEPIAIKNEEAVDRLSGIADYFLVHNREILVRCDDSVTARQGGRTTILRRSRGYVPKPIVLDECYPEVLAVGGHLKAAVCLLKERSAFMSPYIGDMDTPTARDFFFETTVLMKRICECDPRIIAHDLHPGYFTTAAARKMANVHLHAVQHHHAHIVSCMAENRVTEKVIGVSLDGTGYGTDGTIWGGEFLIADELAFERAGHLAPFVLPGGEAAVREPWRTAASLLACAYGDAWPDIAERLRIMVDGTGRETIVTMIHKGINCPVTTSMGRVFDGVAAIIGVRDRVNFEGQAAMELEACAGTVRGVLLPFDIERKDDTVVLDLRETIREIVGGRLAGRSQEMLAADFHATLVNAIGAMVRTIGNETGIRHVALSGGCFQNRLLLAGIREDLNDTGFTVLVHGMVPTNDGGIALGQAVVAGAREKAGIS